jgi:CRP/FNR family transcriptional regulator, cyclic AMP receptor protein
MVTRARQRSFLQLLAELREEDPLIADAIEVEPYDAGRVIAEPALLDTMLYTVAKGRVQLMRTGPKGRQIAMATLGAGSVFGGALLAGCAGAPMRAVALTNCTLWAMRGPRACALAESHPVLTWGMLLTVGDRLSQVETRLEGFAYRRLPAQLAALLLELANGTRFVRGISHQGLAYMLGTYRETVSAVLRRFKDAGLVDLGYRNIELTDAASLRVVAESGD